MMPRPTNRIDNMKAEPMTDQPLTMLRLIAIANHVGPVLHLKASPPLGGATAGARTESTLLAVLQNFRANGVLHVGAFWTDTDPPGVMLWPEGADCEATPAYDPAAVAESYRRDFAGLEPRPTDGTAQPC